MRRIPLYLTFNVGLAGLLGGLVFAAFASGSSQQAGRTRALDQALAGIVEDWANRQVPPEERLLTILVREPLEEAGLLETPPYPGFTAQLLRWALGSLGPEDQTLPDSLSQGGRPLLDWRAETLLWASEKERRFNSLADQIARAHRSQARILVVSQGHGAELALEGLSAARGRAVVDKFVVLGMGRARLKGSGEAGAFLERPTNVREAACLWAQDLRRVSGARWAGSVQLELFARNGTWSRLNGDSLVSPEEGRTSFTQDDLLRAINELGRPDRSMEETLALAGVLPPNATGAWNGRYFYPELRKDGTPYNKAPVPFTARMSQVGERLEGSINEPQTFGPVQAGVLKSFLVNGLVDRAGNIRFVKKYDGTGGVEHAVTYRGTIARDGKTMEGTWLLLTGSEGRFELAKEAPATERPGR